MWIALQDRNHLAFFRLLNLICGKDQVLSFGFTISAFKEGGGLALDLGNTCGGSGGAV